MVYDPARKKWDPMLQKQKLRPGLIPRRLGVLPEAMDYMRVVIRDRQNAIADYYDLEGLYYDWKGEMIRRWMPAREKYNLTYLVKQGMEKLQGEAAME